MVNDTTYSLLLGLRPKKKMGQSIWDIQSLTGSGFEMEGGYKESVKK